MTKSPQFWFIVLMFMIGSSAYLYKHIPYLNIINLGIAAAGAVITGAPPTTGCSKVAAKKEEK